MTIDRFTDKEFSQALPPNAQYIGFKQSEMCWLIHIDNDVAIMIRSSIDSTGRAAESGKDSIRLWLVDPETHQPRSGKVSKYITRVNGWADRMRRNIDILYTWHVNAGACPKCKELKRILIVQKTTQNKGRPFATCGKEDHPFMWLDQFDIVEYPGWNGGVESVAIGEGHSDTIASTHLPGGSDGVAIEEVVDPATQRPENALPEAIVTNSAPSSFLSGTQSTPLEDDPPDRSSPLIQSSPATTIHSPNAEQLSAIETPIDQPVLVLAGPGTGKTFTLAHRYKYLIEQGVKQSEILVVTFGKKAATEMQDRIKLLVPDISQTGLNQTCSIHAACFRMLRSDGTNYSVPKTWQVKKITQGLLNDIWLDVNNRPGWKEVINFTDNVKDKCYPFGSELERNWYWQTLTSYKQNTDWNGDPEYHVDRLMKFREKFDDALAGNRWLRFADMLYLIEYQLTADADFRAKWQDRYKWIIVDEGQDTSQQAVRILDTLASPQNQMMMVGDIDQLLYRFNGSAPEYNLLSFADRYENTKLVKLVTNYRSTQEIVERQVQVIGHNYSDLGGPYDQKFVKELVAHNDSNAGYRVHHIEWDNQKEEAEQVAATIAGPLSLQDPGEIFILARTRAQLAYIEASMLARKIPFINVAGFSFFNLKHIRDIIAYIQVAINPKNSDAFKRIYNIPSIYFEDRTHQYVPHRWLGKAFLETVNSRFDRTDEIHHDSLNRASPEGWWRFEKGAEDLVSFVNGLDGVIQRADHDQNPAAVIKFIIDQCYQKYMRHNDGLSNSDSDEGTGKEDDWNTLIDIASQFDTVIDFVAHAEKLIASGEAKQSENWVGHVIGSTIHRVKGLERDVVFLIGANEGLLPHAFSLNNPPQNGVLPSGGKGRVEDERCAFFVAISRAREVVYVSGVRQMRGKILEPSRFIEEMME